jgi:hypothetical protein
MKYSIILPFWRRLVQFQNTLVSFRHHYAGRDDYEVLVIIDQKHLPEEIEALHALAGWFTDLPLRLIDPEHTDKTWQSPVCHYNQGAREARGEFLIISNPENFHVADILSGLDAEFAKDPHCYVICSCESVIDLGEPVEAFDEVVSNVRHDRWYQHSVHTPRDLHFCSALSLARFNQAGGFDERFKEGIAYDDDDFREAVRKTKAKFVRRDDLKTFHLYHERAHCGLPDYKKRIRHNRDLYTKKWGH